MNMLIVSATEKETEALEKKFWKKNNVLHADFLVTGTGMTATSYHLTKKLSKKRYDLAINLGIAGTFRDEIQIGEVVNVVTDCFADLGAEDGERFLTLSQLGLQDQDKFPFWNGKLKTDGADQYASFRPLKNVKGITVNKVHGHEESIQRVVSKFHPDVESMEGAAFLFVCLMEKIPCIQLRAISNRVERRSRETWDPGLAISNLHEVFSQFITGIEETSALSGDSKNK